MRIKLSTYDGILLAIPLFLCLLLRFFGYDGNSGQDSYAYTGYTQALQNWMHTGIKPISFFWPPGYPLVGAVLSLGFLPASAILQFVSSISLGITLLYLYRLTLKLSTEDTVAKSSFLFFLIWGLFAPFVFRNSVANTSDMLACCMIAGAIYHYIMYLHHTKYIDLFLATLFISYGVFTRYVTILVFLPIIIHIILHWGKNGFIFRHATVLLIPVGILLMYFYFAGFNARFIKHPYLSSWSVDNYFSTHFYTPEGQLTYFFPNIVYILYPLFFPGFCIPGFLFFIKSLLYPLLNRAYFVTLMLSFILFSLFLAGNYGQNPRHLLGIYPVVLILCFGGFHSIHLWLSSTGVWKYILPALILIQILLCARALYPTIKRNKLERYLSKEILSYSQNSNNVLYSFDIDIALKHRQNKIKIKNLNDSVYTYYLPHSLVLINETKWMVQWQNKNPMINFSNLNYNHHLTKLKSYEDGWNLYRIEP